MANNSGQYNEDKKNPVHGMRYMREQFNITQLKTHNHSDILEKLQTYYAFVVVRNPLDRLVSGFKDKLHNPTGNKYYERGLGSKILRALRPSATESEIQTGKGVTFQEYVTHVTNVHMNDQHFENYQDHCQPCIIDFDYIGETGNC